MEMKYRLSIITTLATIAFSLPCLGGNDARRSDRIYLDSETVHGGGYSWKMCRAGEAGAAGERISTQGFDTAGWQDAVVPGTVLTSLVENKVYPDPYYGINNKLSENKIPDLSVSGRDFYTYWFRTEFDSPQVSEGSHVWLQPEGINYRAEFWLNSHLVGSMAGMFREGYIDITDHLSKDGRNVLAVLVYPVDEPGRTMKKKWGATNENHNGGDGMIGSNVTQLMTVGWDFYYDDGIRDRNTGIWKSIQLYTTGPVAMRHPFVKSELAHPDYDSARETVSVEVFNCGSADGQKPVECEVSGRIGEIEFSKRVTIDRGMHETVTFTPEEFKGLALKDPKLWWPKNKGPQNLYKLKMQVTVDGVLSDSLSTTFGIREVLATRNTPDSSKMFIINGKPIFIHGSNWLPEAMQRTSDERMAAELRYTSQSGINLLRHWGGGIAESDYFYQLCDEYGILVWQEFWMTGDTRHPVDEPLYLSNVEATVKRLRNHPSIAFYVASNESTEVSGTRELLEAIDGTRPYQMQSECDGIHDGSPYLQVNPMQHYENTASPRGSRIDGFNPEYGAPNIPLPTSLHAMMDEKDLWPINKEVWDYMDGHGFHKVTTVYTDMTNEYGASAGIDEFAWKGQLVGAMNSKSIWETWNFNKFGYGDRFCSGLLFWYHNDPSPLVCARMWDWYLEPTASLYHTMHSLEPLHIQYDYLKDSVSVINDWPQAFTGYTASASVYDLSSRKVSSQSVRLDIPEDSSVDNIIGLTFPESISHVHFILLTLKDKDGKTVSENFYWRSKDAYEGPGTITGPCTSGFGSLASMPAARLKVKVRRTSGKVGEDRVEVTLRNTSGKIAFFNQLQVFDADGNSVKPAFYSDNFFTIMPGCTKTVTIDMKKGSGSSLTLKGWNTASRKFSLPDPRI